MGTSGESVSAHGGWWSSWRLMLRLVRRDMRRRPGRTALTALLVTLPVMVVAAGGTVMATYETQPDEAIPWRMGSTQAVVEIDPSRAPAQPLVQSTYGEEANALTRSQARQRGIDPAKNERGQDIAPPLPGLKAGDAPTPAAVQRLTGGTVLPTSSTNHRVRIGARRIRIQMLGIDGRQSAYQGMAELTSGRWPRTPEEVLVSANGEAKGLPSSGTLPSTRDDKSSTTFRIVGTVDTPQREDLVGLPRQGGMTNATEGTAQRFLIDRAEPMRWEDVQKLNDHGMVVRSRYVIEHPETATVAPSLILRTQGSGGWEPIIALGTAGFVILIALLAGPAFSTGSARERQALAQLGSNGATRSMLRRYVIAKAVLLGGLAAVAGVLVGAGLGVLLAAQVLPRFFPGMPFGPPDLRWSYGFLIAGTAFLAALIAALLPAVGASRVNLVQVLRGFTVPGRVRTGWPVLGLVICVLSGLIMIGQLRSLGTEVGVVAATFGLFLGALLTVPWILSQVGRLAGTMPLPLRMAMRDVARQRARSFGGVAAIMASVTIMTAAAVAGTSDASGMSQEPFQSDVPVGHGTVSGPPDALREANATVSDLYPDITVRPISLIGKTVREPEPPTPVTGTEFIVGAPYGECSMARAVTSSAERCGDVIASDGPRQFTVVVMQPETAKVYADLTPRQIDAYRSGAVVVFPPYVEKPSASRTKAYDGGALTLEWGTATRSKGTVTGFSTEGRTTVAAMTPESSNGWEAPHPHRRRAWRSSCRRRLRGSTVGPPRCRSST